MKEKATGEMQLAETEIDRKRIFDGVVFAVDTCHAKLSNGDVVRRDVLMHNGGVCILPVHDDGLITLVRQYRYGASEILWEVPAGKLEKGEDPLHSAIRELKEETGLVSAKVTSLGKMYSSPAIMSEIIYFYVAEDLSQGEVQPDEDEFLEIAEFPLDKAMDMVRSGEISDGKTQLLLLKYYTFLKNRKQDY